MLIPSVTSLVTPAAYGEDKEVCLDESSFELVFFFSLIEVTMMVIGSRIKVLSQRSMGLLNKKPY